MLQHTNAMTVYHTYPHVDFFETGSRAAQLLLRVLAGEVRPVTGGSRKRYPRDTISGGGGQALAGDG